MLRTLLTVVVTLLAPLVVQAQEDPEPGGRDLDPSNPICGPDVSAGRFKISQVGPQIAGNWEATAPGLGFTKGVQTFRVVVSFERGRLYMSGGGTPKIELKPVYGTRKALRYDPIRQQPLPENAQAVKATLEDIGLITDCEIGLAPQFTWTYGVGAQSSGGFYSFFDDHTAVGTMWNKAQGAREVYLSRKR